jgi:hypothetical protein
VVLLRPLLAEPCIDVASLGLALGRHL